MKKTLFIAWKDKNPSRWLTVARLCCIDKRYIFCYTKGALKSDNFVPFGRFLSLNNVYVSDELFPLFENRILNSNRSEFNDFLSWLSLDNKSYDPLDILALTEGRRETDNLEIFPYPKIDDNNVLTINFFTHGLNYINNLSQENLNSLHPKDNLFLCQDRQNPKDQDAILLRSDDPIMFVGYCPRYLVKDFNILLKNNSKIKVYIKKINPNAPYSYRILCTIEAKCPPNFVPYSEDQFLPIPSKDSFKCLNTDCKISCK